MDLNKEAFIDVVPPRRILRIRFHIKSVASTKPVEIIASSPACFIHSDGYVAGQHSFLGPVLEGAEVEVSGLSVSGHFFGFNR